jgi:hypothetical protein
MPRPVTAAARFICAATRCKARLTIFPPRSNTVRNTCCPIPIVRVSRR